MEKNEKSKKNIQFHFRLPESIGKNFQNSLELRDFILDLFNQEDINQKPDFVKSLPKTMQGFIVMYRFFNRLSKESGAAPFIKKVWDRMGHYERKYLMNMLEIMKEVFEDE